MRYVGISKGWPKVYDGGGMEVAVVNRLFCGRAGCGGTVGWVMVLSLLIYFPSTGKRVRWVGEVREVREAAWRIYLLPLLNLLLLFRQER